MLISNGFSKDQVMMKIKNRFLFSSNVTGEPLEADKVKLIKSFPKQLPRGVVEEELVADASKAANAMTGLLILQLIAQIFLKGGMDDLWSLYFSLQIMCYLSIYDTPIPANAEIYV